jgi:hypothetical protein
LEQVVDLLGVLADALDDCERLTLYCPFYPYLTGLAVFEIVTGNLDNRTLSYARTIQPGHLSEQTEELPAGKGEAHDILDVASECIRSLLRISILIRKATPRDRFNKALQTTSGKNNPFLDQFDISHVAERYPKLKKNESKWLCERLGRAITKRRQFLRYSRQHRFRVAGATEWSEEFEEAQSLSWPETPLWCPTT